MCGSFFKKRNRTLPNGKVLCVMIVGSVKFKAHGQEFIEREFAVCENDRKIIVAEFAHDLQASTAGTAWVAVIALRSADDGYGFETFEALGHCFEYSCAFCTVCQ